MNKKKAHLGLSLTLISGKGGSGKTVIGLAMSKVLSQAGFTVLLVDCDTSTHGATYFVASALEKSGNVLSFSALLDPHRNRRERKPFKTKDGFDFIPSTLAPTDDNHDYSPEPGIVPLQDLSGLIQQYDIVIFDCQAGYNKVVRDVCQISKSHLIVMEPDAVSSAAVRVLFLQLGTRLRASSTWQVFNKLTEEERPIYSKVMGGTLFTNLPAVPFDWSVRAAFSVKEIPTIMSNDSAFGLGILRLTSALLPECRDALAVLEKETVGEWYTTLQEQIRRLDMERKILRSPRIATSLIERLLLLFQANAFLPLIIVIVATTIPLQYLFGRYSVDEMENVSPWKIAVLFSFVAALSMGYIIIALKRSRESKKREMELEALNKIETELNRFRTLIATDPRLREYQREDAQRF